MRRLRRDLRLRAERRGMTPQAMANASSIFSKKCPVCKELVANSNQQMQEHLSTACKKLPTYRGRSCYAALRLDSAGRSQVLYTCPTCMDYQSGLREMVADHMERCSVMEGGGSSPHPALASRSTMHSPISPFSPTPSPMGRNRMMSEAYLEDLLHSDSEEEECGGGAGAKVTGSASLQQAEGGFDWNEIAEAFNEHPSFHGNEEERESEWREGNTMWGKGALDEAIVRYCLSHKVVRSVDTVYDQKLLDTLQILEHGLMNGHSNTSMEKSIKLIQSIANPDDTRIQRIPLTFRKMKSMALAGYENPFIEERILIPEIYKKSTSMPYVEYYHYKLESLINEILFDSDAVKLGEFCVDPVVQGKPKPILYFSTTPWIYMPISH